MPQIFKRLFAGLGIVAGLALAGNGWAQDCKPAARVTTVTPGVLTVTTGPLPPFDVIDGTGNYSGIDADILRIFAAKMCLTLKPVVVDPAAMIQYVVSGRADMSALNWWRSAARAKVLNIGSPMFLERMALYSSLVRRICGRAWAPEACQARDTGRVRRCGRSYSRRLFSW